MPGRLVISKLAKTHRTYTIAEVVDLYGVSRGTMSNWQRQGLRPIDDKRPLLFHGATINAFHAERRRTGKKPCPPGELFCLACKEPRRPPGGRFEYTPLNGTVGTVKAICPICGTLMHQRVNNRRLAAFEAAQSDADGDI